MPENSQLTIAGLPTSQMFGINQCQYVYKNNTTGKTFRCPEESYHRGLCRKHWLQQKQNKTPQLFKNQLGGLGDTFDKFNEDNDLLDLRSTLSLLNTMLVGLLKEAKRKHEENPEDGSFEALLGDNLKQINSIVDRINTTASNIDKIERSRGYVIDAKQAMSFINNVVKCVMVHFGNDKPKIKSFMNELRAIPFKSDSPDVKVSVVDAE